MEFELKALLRNILSQVQAQEQSLMATLDDILTNLKNQQTMLDGVTTLLANLKAEITKLQLAAPDQAKIDEIFAVAEANAAKLTADLTENVEPVVPSADSAPTAEPVPTP